MQVEQQRPAARSRGRPHAAPCFPLVVSGILEPSPRSAAAVIYVLHRPPDNGVAEPKPELVVPGRAAKKTKNQDVTVFQVSVQRSDKQLDKAEHLPKPKRKAL